MRQPELYDDRFPHDRPKDHLAHTLKAVRRHCLGCMAQQSAEVKRCHIYGCWLWPYRMGKTPPNLKNRQKTSLTVSLAYYPGLDRELGLLED